MYQPVHKQNHWFTRVRKHKSPWNHACINLNTLNLEFKTTSLSIIISRGWTWSNYYIYKQYACIQTVFMICVLPHMSNSEWTGMLIKYQKLLCVYKLCFIACILSHRPKSSLPCSPLTVWPVWQKHRPQ